MENLLVHYSYYYYWYPMLHSGLVYLDYYFHCYLSQMDSFFCFFFSYKVLQKITICTRTQNQVQYRIQLFF